MSAALGTFLEQVSKAIGAQWVDTREATLARYGEHTLPAGARAPGAVLFPDSTADVQAIVAAANRHGVPLYPISTGNNIGLGSRAPVASGQVVVDLGFRMNRILEVNEEICYAVLEPGVSFQTLHDELARRGDKLMISELRQAGARPAHSTLRRAALRTRARPAAHGGSYPRIVWPLQRCVCNSGGSRMNTEKTGTNARNEPVERLIGSQSSSAVRATRCDALRGDLARRLGAKMRIQILLRL